MYLWIFIINYIQNEYARTYVYTCLRNIQMERDLITIQLHHFNLS